MDGGRYTIVKFTQKLLPFGEEPAVESARDKLHSALERMEGWLLDARGRPVDDRAEETLRCLTRALLEGKNGYWHAAEDRLQAMQADPPGHVTDHKAFAETLDELLDHLHGALSVGRSR